MTSIILQSNTLNDWPIASNSVQMIATSPPYWGLRDYGIAGQFGLECVPDCLGWATGAPCGDCYVCHSVQWAREAWRVLRNDGVMFLNLGDSYANDTKWGGSSGGKNYTSAAGGYGGQRLKRNTGLKPKELAGIPWRVALALQADGWYLRQDIVWAKPNPMPESVQDRCTKSHEYIFLLAKSPRYFWDGDAVKEKSTGKNGGPVTFKRETKDHVCPGQSVAQNRIEREDRQDNGTRNPHSVWTVSTSHYSTAHFATWPPALVERMILAGSSDKSCPTCGKCWRRIVDRKKSKRVLSVRTIEKRRAGLRTAVGGEYVETVKTKTLGFAPACKCYGVLPG